MAFLDILKELVDNVSGGFAGTIMGVDGISVQDYVKEGSSCDLETIGVEYGNIVGEIKKASEVLNLGEVEEVVISSHGVKVLLRLVNKEYFVAFVLTPEGNLGKARYLLKKAANTARRELAG